MDIIFNTTCGKTKTLSNAKLMTETQKKDYSDAFVGSTISSIADRYDPTCEFYEVSSVDFA